MMWPVAVLVVVGLAVAGCGGQSAQDKAKAWVRSHGGTVAADGSGWVATESSWTGTWPWPASDATVGCAPQLYGGTTYVQLDGRQYWLSESHGYPPAGSVYVASAASVTTDDAAQIEWSTESADMCGLK